MLLKAGTEVDRLSQLQTDFLCELLTQTVPELRIEKKALSESNSENTLFVLGKSGIDEREVLRAVKDRRVDFAVQSMKHVLAFEEDLGLSIPAVLERSSPAEVLVSKENVPLQNLRPGSVVEVSNPIRMSQLRRTRPGVQAKAVRGTVEARISRVDAGECDAVILAEAAMARLGVTEKISERLKFRDFIPFPGQGIIAVVARRDDERVNLLLAKLDHKSTRVEANAEQQLVRKLRAESKVPVGAMASASGDRIRITARVLSKDGKEMIEAEAAGYSHEAKAVGMQAAKELVAKGAARLEESWRVLRSRPRWSH